MPATINCLKFALVLLLFTSGSAYAKSAHETAKSFYDLLKQKNYSTAAGYYDPAALSEFRKLMSETASAYEIRPFL